MDLYKGNRADQELALHKSSFDFSVFRNDCSVQPGLMSVLVFVYPCSLASHGDGY